MITESKWSAMERRTVQEAISWADYMLSEYSEPKTVFYHHGTDRYGRDGVFYVRPPDDPEMLTLQAARIVEAVYHAS